MVLRLPPCLVLHFGDELEVRVQQRPRLLGLDCEARTERHFRLLREDDSGLGLGRQGADFVVDRLQICG